MPFVSPHFPILRFAVPAAILLLGFGIKIFHKRSKDKSLKNSGLPITLKYDAWQTAPALAAFVFVAGTLGYTVPLLLRGFANHPHESPASVFGITTLLAILAVMVVAVLGWLLFKIVSPDRVVICTDTIQLYSLGRTRQWTWRQIANVELKTVQEARGGTHEVVCLHVPDEQKPITLPRFLRSDDGPEEEKTIYELVRNQLSRARAA